VQDVALTDGETKVYSSGWLVSAAYFMANFATIGSLVLLQHFKHCTWCALDLFVGWRWKSFTDYLSTLIRAWTCWLEWVSFIFATFNGYAYLLTVTKWLCLAITVVIWPAIMCFTDCLKDSHVLLTIVKCPIIDADCTDKRLSLQCWRYTVLNITRSLAVVCESMLQNWH